MTTTHIRKQGPKAKRYTLKQLLRGVTPKKAGRLNAETEWARKWKPVGREAGERAFNAGD